MLNILQKKIVWGLSIVLMLVMPAVFATGWTPSNAQTSLIDLKLTVIPNMPVSFFIQGFNNGEYELFQSSLNGYGKILGLGRSIPVNIEIGNLDYGEHIKFTVNNTMFLFVSGINYTAYLDLYFYLYPYKTLILHSGNAVISLNKIHTTDTIPVAKFNFPSSHNTLTAGTYPMYMSFLAIPRSNSFNSSLPQIQGTYRGHFTLQISLST